MLPVSKKRSDAATSSALSRAMERFRANRRVTRIGFIVDATGSRAEGWEEAQTVQARMFRSAGEIGRVALRLVHYGGGDLTDRGWATDPTAAAKRMAAVRCRRGLTQILPALRLFLGEAEAEAADALILVGDAFEEDADEAEGIARHLKAAGFKVFAFFEGDNDAAADTFRRIASVTGGKFARLGDDLPLGDLCAGVALLTSGGAQAVKRLKNEKARMLLLTGPSSKQ